MDDRISLRDLRKLAREALGSGARVAESDCDEPSLTVLVAHVDGVDITAQHADKYAARRQLRQFLQDIVTGRELREEDSNGCPP